MQAQLIVEQMCRTCGGSGCSDCDNNGQHRHVFDLPDVRHNDQLRIEIHRLSRCRMAQVGPINCVLGTDELPPDLPDPPAAPIPTEPKATPTGAPPPQQRGAQ